MVIILANEHRFSQSFHSEMLQEIFYGSVIDISTLAELYCYITLQNLKIQYICVSNTIPSSSHNFFHSALSVAAKQSGSEPRQLRGMGILQESKHHRITHMSRWNGTVWTRKWSAVDELFVEFLQSNYWLKWSAVIHLVTIMCAEGIHHWQHHDHKSWAHMVLL